MSAKQGVFQVPFIEYNLNVMKLPVVLRVVPSQNHFCFHTPRELTEQEKQVITGYLRQEGFLDNPYTGEMPGDAGTF
jgi:hypothetical protein